MTNTEALTIVMDVARTTAMRHRDEGRRVLADQIEAALSALGAPDFDAYLRPETTSEHIARDLREGTFPEKSERRMVRIIANLKIAAVEIGQQGASLGWQRTCEEAADALSALGTAPAVAYRWRIEPWPSGMWAYQSEDPRPGEESGFQIEAEPLYASLAPATAAEIRA